jgi:hypothetical protein
MSRAMFNGLAAAPASSAIGFSTAAMSVASAATTCGAAFSALLAPVSHLRTSSAPISIPFSIFTSMFAIAMFSFLSVGKSVTELAAGIEFAATGLAKMAVVAAVIGERRLAQTNSGAWRSSFAQ